MAKLTSTVAQIMIFTMFRGNSGLLGSNLRDSTRTTTEAMQTLSCQPQFTAQEGSLQDTKHEQRNDGNLLPKLQLQTLDLDDRQSQDDEVED